MQSSLYQAIFEHIACEIEKGVRIYRYAPRRRLVHPVLIEQAERFFVNTGASITCQGNPSYCQNTDRVTLPRIEQQKDEARAISASCHELVHWTGAAHRLNRQYDGMNWAQRYGMEEMVAEFGAAFLCADLGVTADILPYAAAYIADYGNAVRAESYMESKAVIAPNAFAAAAPYAEEAVAYLHSLQT